MEIKFKIIFFTIFKGRFSFVNGSNIDRVEKRSGVFIKEKFVDVRVLYILLLMVNKGVLFFFIWGWMIYIRFRFGSF